MSESPDLDCLPRATPALPPASSTLAVWETMEEYPGAELSFSQLVYALEERLNRMMNRSW